MATFFTKKTMESGRSSRPTGHSRAQVKVTSNSEKALFSRLICGLLFYHGRLYLTYLKDRKLKKILRGRHRWKHETHGQLKAWKSR